MEKEKIIETIKNIQKGCNELTNEGIPCVFAVGHTKAGVHLSSSIPVTQIPFFICDVIQFVRNDQVTPEKHSEEEIKKEGNGKVIPFVPNGEV